MKLYAKQIAALAATAAITTTASAGVTKDFIAGLIPVNDTPEGAGLVHIYTPDKAKQNTWHYQADKNLNIVSVTGETVSRQGASTTVISSAGTVESGSVKNITITSYKVDGAEIPLTNNPLAPAVHAQWDKELTETANKGLTGLKALSGILKAASVAHAEKPAGFCALDGTGHGGFKQGDNLMNVTIKDGAVTMASNTWSNVTYSGNVISDAVPAPARDMLSTLLKAIPKECAPK